VGLIFYLDLKTTKPGKKPGFDGTLSASETAPSALKEYV